WEAFVFANVEGFLYAYNALLQGYGDWLSDYRFSRADIETFTLELREGLVLGSRSVDLGTGHRHHFRLVLEPYSFRSREFRGAKARAHAWGSIRVSMGETFELPSR